MDNTNINNNKIPYGTYTVMINDISMKLINNVPYIILNFKVIHQKYNNTPLIIKQAISAGHEIHMVNQWLEVINDNKPIIFNNYNEYHMLIDELLEKATSVNKLYTLEYQEKHISLVGGVK